MPQKACHLRLQAASILEVQRLQGQLLDMTHKAEKMTASIAQRNKECNYKPIADELENMLGPLNQEVIRAM